MRSTALSLLSLVAVTAFVGCAEPSSSDAPQANTEGAQEQDFVSRGGVTLKAPSDSALKISLMMYKGAQTRTRNQRFIKATVYRGAKSFGAFCDMSGDHDSASKSSAKISCSIGVATVSDDDNESLGFDIVLKRDGSSESITLDNVFYSGDGTFLGDQAAIIGHNEEPALKLDAQEANNNDKNALAFARTLLDATKPLLSERVQSEEVNQPVAVKSASFYLDSKLDLNVSLKLGRTGALYASLPKQSLLKTAGDLSQGVLDAAAITTKLKAALPR
jgi:hypothetical protein